jgi:hypothetical protein
VFQCMFQCVFQCAMYRIIRWVKCVISASRGFSAMVRQNASMVQSLALSVPSSVGMFYVYI